MRKQYMVPTGPKKPRVGPEFQAIIPDLVEETK
jgi:hypothetical protein